MAHFFHMDSLERGRSHDLVDRYQSDLEVLVFLDGIIFVILLGRIRTAADDLNVHLAVADRRILHDGEFVATLLHLEADVQLADYDLDHVESPSGNRSVHHQILNSSRIESDLEGLLVHKFVSRGHEVSRVRASVVLRIWTLDPGILEVAVEDVVSLESAFQFGGNHGAKVVVLLDDVGQRHVYENVVSAFRAVHRPFGLPMGIIDGNVRN